MLGGGSDGAWRGRAGPASTGSRGSWRGAGGGQGGGPPLAHEAAVSVERVEAQTLALEQRPLLEELGRSDGVLRPVPEVNPDNTSPLNPELGTSAKDPARL